MDKRISAIDKSFLQKILYECDTYVEVLERIGVKVTKNNVRCLGYYVIKWKLDKSKMNGRKFVLGQKPPHTVPLEEILVKDSKWRGSGNQLRKRLIGEGVFEHRCNKCKLDMWLGRPIPLQIEHKNGDGTDNRIENIELLCPNCHALTDTYCGKNTQVHKRKLLIGGCPVGRGA